MRTRKVRCLALRSAPSLRGQRRAPKEVESERHPSTHSGGRDAGDEMRVTFGMGLGTEMWANFVSEIKTRLLP